MYFRRNRSKKTKKNKIRTSAELRRTELADTKEQQERQGRNNT